MCGGGAGGSLLLLLLRSSRVSSARPSLVAVSRGMRSRPDVDRRPCLLGVSGSPEAAICTWAEVDNGAAATWASRELPPELEAPESADPGGRLGCRAAVERPMASICAVGDWRQAVAAPDPDNESGEDASVVRRAPRGFVTTFGGEMSSKKLLAKPAVAESVRVGMLSSDWPAVAPALDGRLIVPGVPRTTMRRGGLEDAIGVALE